MKPKLGTSAREAIYLLAVAVVAVPLIIGISFVMTSDSGKKQHTSH